MVNMKQRTSKTAQAILLGQLHDWSPLGPDKGQKRSAPRKPSGSAALKRAARTRRNIRAKGKK